MAHELERYTRSELCGAFDVSPQTVTNWIRKYGFDVARVGKGRGRAERWDITKAIRWREEFVREEERAKAPKNDTASDLGAAKLRRWKADADAKEIELATLRGDLIPKDVATRTFRRAIAALRTRILNFPGRWAAQLVGLENPKEARAALERAVRELLATLSESGAEIRSGSPTDALPDDFPAIAILRARGVSTWAELAALGDPATLEGIGPKRKKEIKKAARRRTNVA